MTMEWISTRPVPLDHGGPASVPYTPLATAWSELAGIRPFERAAARFPDKVAVDDGQVRLTYAEVLDRVYGLAARIAAAVPPGTVVSSLVGTTAAAPIIIMACIAAGRTLVPLDASHPLERQIALFAESGAQALIVEDGATADDSYVPAALPRIAIDPRVPTHAPPMNTPGDPEAPMFVIFTSGSTGRPKGLAYANRHSAMMAQSIESFHINETDVILGLGSLTAGGSRDAFMALTTGATVRLLDIKTAGMGEALRVLREEGITFMSFVPSFVRMLFSLPGIEDVMHSLRILDMHGERTLASDIALMRSKLPKDCHISITLGASETGFVFTWFVDDAKIGTGTVPVGYLIPGKEVAILGEDGASVAVGETGELMVRGLLPAGGWQAGRLTAGRFIPDPAGSGQRIYPMGDLVRMRADGLFDHIGRRDRQVKIRGLWADLGEIEVALRGCGGIADAVVDVMPGDDGTDRIIAFVAPDGADERPDLPQLRRAVSAATAEHMVPSAIHVLATIPRLANYKPDLVRLRAMAAV